MDQGQAETQPAIQPALPDSMNPFEAQAAIAAMLEREENPPRDEKGKFKAKTEEAPATPEPKAEEAKAEPEEAPKPETPEEEAQPETRKLKLKYKGEEKEFLEPEVIELAQKGYDYTQKSQALAKEREEFGVKVKSESEAARTKYEQQLETYRLATLRLVDPEVLNADLSQIAAQDPAKAQQLFFKRQQIAETLNAIGAEQQKLTQQRQAESHEQLQKQVKESWEALETKIPGWSNDSYRKILEFGAKTYGFQQQEVNAITDHRAIEVLNDARQWREYQAAKPNTVDKRVTSVPKVQKPGTGESPNAKPDKIKEGMAQLSKTGRREDAVSLITQMIEDGRI